MKLRYSPTSPYVRKVVVCAAELGLGDRIELVPTDPRDAKSGLADENPLGKVPALVTDDCGSLFDSRVICEYLDALHDGPKLFPSRASERWAAQRLHALGDGMLDAALLCRLEGARPAEKQWDGWVAHQRTKIDHGLAALESEAAGFGDALTIGVVTIACMLGYLDFRFADMDWRADCPRLAEWFDGFAKRPSMAASVPQDPA